MTLEERFDKIWGRAAGIETLMDCMLQDGNEKYVSTLAKAAKEWAREVLNASDSTAIEIPVSPKKGIRNG